MIICSIIKDLKGNSSIVYKDPYVAVGNLLSSSIRTRIMFNEVKKSINAVKNKELDLPFEQGFDAHDFIISENEVSIEPYYGQSDIATLSVDEFEEILNEWGKVLS